MVKKQAVDVGKIRERLAMKKGRRVELYAIGERNRVTRAQGVLDGVYPGI
ncbi:MAG: Veg family protein, partial [Christensenellaceae bacterium]